MTKTVLVVDDDPVMRGMLAEYLGDHEFLVEMASDSGEMAGVLARSTVGLVLLDLKLPDEDGLDLLRTLRCESAMPVIVVTGHRRKEVDRVVGLELGADDYLTKPFGLRELLARIRAVMRRRDACALCERARDNGEQSAADQTPTRYRFAGWELDLRSRRLKAPNTSLVALTKSEFNLLMAFLRSPRRVLSREQLLAASRVHEDEVFDRSIDVQILRLRRKLEPDPSQPELIRTERGAGYVFAVPVEAN